MSFIIVIISVISLFSFGRGLPLDYNYDNYVNVNLDNTNANAYYMDNKPGFDYSVNYSPYTSNYYGVYRQEPVAPVKPHFVYPFHTIFVITTAPHNNNGQSNNGGTMMDQMATGQFDQPEQPMMGVPTPHHHHGHHGEVEDMPIFLKHDFGHDGPVSSTQVVPDFKQEYPVVQPHQTNNEDAQQQNNEEVQIVDYPIVINAQPPQSQQQQDKDQQNDDDEAEEVEVKGDQMMVGASSMENNSKMDQSKVEDDKEKKQATPVVTPLSSEIDMLTTESPIKLVQDEEKVVKNMEMTPEEEKVAPAAAVTFETIDADDEIFMTTESGTVVGQEENVMTTELSL